MAGRNPIPSTVTLRRQGGTLHPANLEGFLVRTLRTGIRLDARFSLLERAVVIRELRPILHPRGNSWYNEKESR